MKRTPRRARRARFAVALRAQHTSHICEALESRRLLDANDPVVVMTQAFSLIAFESVSAASVTPHLWNNPSGEVPWNLDDWESAPWNDATHDHDYDNNGKHDDVYGWNFDASSPNIIDNSVPSGAHGAAALDAVLRAIADAETAANARGADGAALASHIKIMYVVGGLSVDVSGTPSPALQYVLDKKTAFLNGQPGGANIVAVGPGAGDRAAAEALRDVGTGVLVFLPVANDNEDLDPTVGNTWNACFNNATPNRFVQLPPVENIIPVTTDPTQATPTDKPTDYGINSFYFAAPEQRQQSFSNPRAAGYAAASVAWYQSSHSGQTPGWQDVKRSMMSGVSFGVPELTGHTITHDYDSVNGRKGGGLLDVGKAFDAINTNPTAIDGVALTPIGLTPDPFGTTEQFSLPGSSDVSNWTINWGDNNPSEVVPGTALPQIRSHEYPATTAPHHYFPTVFAVSSTNGQVYLASPAAEAGAEVTISPALAPSSGKDDYTLSRSGNTVTITEANSMITTTSRSFSVGALASLTLSLGEGGDTLTIDCTGGNPLESMSLTVQGLIGAGNIVRVIGSAGADTITVNGSSVTVQDAQTSAGFTLGANLSLYVGGAGISDSLSVSGNARVDLDDSETFGQVSVSNSGGVVVDEDGGLALRVRTLSVTSGGYIDLNDNAFILDYAKASQVAVVTALIAAARNGGAWNGTGITSTTARDNAFHNTSLGAIESADFKAANGNNTLFAGQSVDATAVLVKYTYNGDATLDGRINFDDYVRFDTGVGKTGWFNGDFDYDGGIDFDDGVLIDVAFNTQIMATTGQDNYRLSRIGDNVTFRLTNSNGTISIGFAPGVLSPLFVPLGQGNDTLTIDFSGGNPLQWIDLTVFSRTGVGNLVRVIGTTSGENFTVSGSSVTVQSSQFLASFPLDSNLALYVNGGGGADILNVSETPRVHLDESETFSQVNISNSGGVIFDANGSRLLQTEALSITSGGLLDLNDNDLLLDYTSASPLLAVQGLIYSARSNGAWTGAGLTSSSARNSVNHNTTLGLMEASEYKDLMLNPDASFDGQAIDSTAVLVKYTYGGDANFDGRITFDDYVRIDTGFNQHRTGWTNGDFNLNGVVNFDDYVMIDIAFNTQNGTLGAALGAAQGDQMGVNGASGAPNGGSDDGSDGESDLSGVEKVLEHLDLFGDDYRNALLSWLE